MTIDTPLGDPPATNYDYWESMKTTAYPYKKTFDFGTAIKAMKDGFRVSRFGWNGKNMWIAIEYPKVDQSKMTQPFIYMFTATHDYIPWLASQADMLADDWSIVE